MKKYAVIQLGSKQFLVEEGSVLELERQPKSLNIDVLLFSDGKKTTIGEPYVKGAQVKAKILEDKRGEKIRVARFKSKSRYRKVKGHRQPLSVVEIQTISLGTEKPKAEKKTTSKKAVTKTKAKTKVKKVTKKETK